MLIIDMEMYFFLIFLLFALFGAPRPLRQGRLRPIPCYATDTAVMMMMIITIVPFILASILLIIQIPREVLDLRCVLSISVF